MHAARCRFYGAKRPWLSLWESGLPRKGQSERVPRSNIRFQPSNGVPSQSACSADSSPKGRAKGAAAPVRQITIFIGCPPTALAGQWLFLAENDVFSVLQKDSSPLPPVFCGIPRFCRKPSAGVCFSLTGAGCHAIISEMRRRGNLRVRCVLPHSGRAFFLNILS